MKQILPVIFAAVLTVSALSGCSSNKGGTVNYYSGFPGGKE